ncbi:MAG: effector binding domain-containing protein [bacterium]|nr:effector binding domain-containing protein [bacterium]
MEWTESLKKSISYIEANLLEEISADDVADQVHMSSFYLQKLFAGNGPETDVEHAICDCKIGEYGVCVNLCKDGRFRYLIAGIYHGGKVPEGMSLFEFPETEWVKFRCVGSMPGAMQSVNTKIFKEWLPGNTEFKISMGANIERYLYVLFILYAA